MGGGVEMVERVRGSYDSGGAFATNPRTSLYGRLAESEWEGEEAKRLTGARWSRWSFEMTV